MITLTKDKVVLIIPAFNEEERIGEVVTVAKRVKAIDKILVVNDGSSDKTAQVVEAAGVDLLNIPLNHGKGYAMQKGIDAIQADIYVFSDADILGLKEDHLLQLIEPFAHDQELLMTVGKFSGGRMRTDISQNLLPSISGQRGLRQKFIADLPDLSSARFGAEIVISRHAKATGAKTLEVTLKDLTHVMKEEKLGVVRGLSARMKMYQEMYRTMKPQK